ncbi:sphingomyelin phosphodiesterase [Lentinula aff. detonsa]|uniref:Sphingomyelin phosphodiesterase n=1 Tax=Lentinula aff. detonsa TaxID=2804958 RepID=A0AA38KQP2_9AGAR|nr:sphingomyelin phosphodiesterase [Lentinula aff. detonsa]
MLYNQLYSFWIFTIVLTIFPAYGVVGQNSSQILDVFESIVDCASCLAALIPLQVLAHLGNDAFSDTFIAVCDVAQLEDPDVCSGLMSRLGPIIAHDLRSIDVAGQTAPRLCDALFGFCASKTPNPFAVPLPSPSVPLAPPSEPTVRKTPFQVVHISDVHIDREYTVGSEANCTKNICCRNFADETGDPITDPAQPFGNSKCDSPPSLADSMLDAVNSFNAQFVIFTGDVVEGAIWLTTQEQVKHSFFGEVTSDLTDFNAEMLSKISAPIFPAIGVHSPHSDSTPVNSFPRNTTDTTLDVQWVFDTQSAGWEQWIGSAASQQVDHISGSYAATVPDMNLVILSLNTQYWYRQNLWLYDSDTFQPDPNGILSFMVEQLQAAENNGQRVWVIGHIPLGKSDIVEDQSNYYDQILQRYKDTIVGQFFGHSHKDQFEIAYSDYNDQTAANAVGVGLVCPALTPTSGNPAFKVYDVDPDTFGIMNIRVIFANITDPSFQENPSWAVYYDARETYGSLVGLPTMSELTPAFWHNLTEVFMANDTAFQLFNTFLSRGGDVAPCTDADNCKNTTICDQRAFRSQNNCDVDEGAFGMLRRRNSRGSQRQEGSECEGIGIREILDEIRGKLRV